MFKSMLLGRMRGQGCYGWLDGCQRKTAPALRAGAAAFDDNAHRRGRYPGYQAAGMLAPGQTVQVPARNYYAMGDNSPHSQDSRYWGFVPRENIIGRPLLIYWSASNLNNDLTVSPTAGDRLYHLAYAVTHMFQITRWERTFRLVR